MTKKNVVQSPERLQEGLTGNTLTNILILDCVTTIHVL